jgi:hypothetical protein
MITALMDLNRMPNRLQDQKVFDDFMAEYMRLLPLRGQQENDLVAMVNAAVAGGAYALAYVFDTATADADPGAGKLRLSNVIQNASTVLRLDVLAGGQDYTSVIDRFDASTSTVKGSIRLVKMGDPSKWLTFDVTARTTLSGYRNLTVANTGGSSASPFAAGDGVLLFFQRTGDKGDTGNQLTQMIHVREEYVGGTAAPYVATGAIRVLNTTKINTVAGASLSSSQVTLPAGTYDFEGSAPLVTPNIGHRVALYNATDSQSVLSGPNELSGNTNYQEQTRAYVRGRITIASAKSFCIQHVISGSGAWLGGTAISVGTEIYAELIFRKVS